MKTPFARAQLWGTRAGTGFLGFVLAAVSVQAAKRNRNA